MNEERMKGFARCSALSVLFALFGFLAGGWDSPCAAAEPPDATTVRRDTPSGSRSISRPSRPLKPAAKSGEPRKQAAGSFWKTLIVLAVIVAVILAAAKHLKKHGPRLSGGIPADAMELLGKRAIDRGQLIYLVRLGSRILIIGSSAAGLQTLGEINDPVEIDYLSGLCRQPTQSSGITQGFLSLFNRQFAGSPAPREPEEADHVGENTKSVNSQYDAPREEAHV